jgi:histidine triad (HIT) family protein
VAEGNHVHAADGFVAIRDVNPIAETHLLVVPERHVDTFRDVDAFPDEEAGRMLRFVAETAASAGLDDYKVLVNVGERGGQTIFHLHWHVLGGRFDTGRLSRALELETAYETSPLARGRGGRAPLCALRRSTSAALRWPRRPDPDRTDRGELKAARRDATAATPEPCSNSLQAAQKELQRPLSDDEELYGAPACASGGSRRRAFRAGGEEERPRTRSMSSRCSRSSCPSRCRKRRSRDHRRRHLEVGATNIRDMGRVMAGVMHQVSGRADGSVVSQLVKEKLA